MHVRTGPSPQQFEFGPKHVAPLYPLPSFSLFSLQLFSSFMFAAFCTGLMKKHRPLDALRPDLLFPGSITLLSLSATIHSEPSCQPSWCLAGNLEYAERSKLRLTSADAPKHHDWPGPAARPGAPAAPPRPREPHQKYAQGARPQKSPHQPAAE